MRGLGLTLFGVRVRQMISLAAPVTEDLLLPVTATHSTWTFLI